MDTLQNKLVTVQPAKVQTKTRPVLSRKPLEPLV